ncbi:MAG: metallophosphoesterase [Akkermansiaceae bacterium]|nr:metallophosphoesterase [Akkermansiaceae bacterium]
MKLSPSNMPPVTRRRVLRMIAGSFVATTAGAGVNAAWIEPESLTITRRDIPCPNLPPGLDGLRVCLVSDLHYREPDEDDPLLERVVDAIHRETPDLVLMPGDFIDSDEKMMAPLLRRISGLQAKHGVFASLGNHDGWNADSGRARRLFEKAGFGMLINDHSRLSIRGESLYVAGTDFVWDGNPDPVRMLRGVPADAPLVTLVHEPDYFDTVNVHRAADLQVSGHTHGGQCRVPLVGIAPVKPRWGRKYVEGHFRKDGANLFVTRGVGTTGLRVRFACPPELAVLTLRGRSA